MDSKVTKIRGSWIRFLKTSVIESSVNVACMLNALGDVFWGGFLERGWLGKSSDDYLKCLKASV